MSRPKHSKVRTSKPGADGSMQDSLMGLWHLEQARTPISARRLNRELGWTDGMMLARDTLSHRWMPNWGGDGTSMPSEFWSRWSLLLIFQNERNSPGYPLGWGRLFGAGLLIFF